MQVKGRTAAAVAILEDSVIVFQEELTYANGISLKDTDAGLEPAMDDIQLGFEGGSARTLERTQLELEERSRIVGNHRKSQREHLTARRDSRDLATVSTQLRVVWKMRYRSY